MSERRERASFGAGCFWGVQARFDEVPGVVETTVGYQGGHTEAPTYEQVCAKRTGHAEVCEVVWDPERVTYDELLAAFWKMHDPTQLDRQGPDVGDQYRSVLFCTTEAQEHAARASLEAERAGGRHRGEVVTRVERAPTFWPAEDYHQKYLARRNCKRC
ncbi:MAG: peptide-methionine (S)-S-oxide reductase MsrA [Planctomycetota bacterium]